MSIPPIGRSAKQQLVLTAERLFAVHGIDGVPLRQIGTAAGMANKSAVQYHFGSKEGLVEAILVNRLDDLDRRRALLQARTSADDLRGVVEAHHLPLIELAEDEDCYYLQFLEQLGHLRQKVHPLDRLPPSNRAFEDAYKERLTSLLGDIPEPLREIRIRQASATSLHVCADRHRGKNLGAPVPPYAVHVSQLLDSLIAHLITPPSAETLAALGAWTESNGRRTTTATPKRNGHSLPKVAPAGDLHRPLSMTNSAGHRRQSRTSVTQTESLVKQHQTPGAPADAGRPLKSHPESEPERR